MYKLTHTYRRPDDTVMMGSPTANFFSQVSFISTSVMRGRLLEERRQESETS